jgi:rhamnulokinase
MAQNAKSPCFLAYDFGAESGRLVAGHIEKGNVLKLEDVHRFSNGPVRVGETLYWDVLRLWSEILKGLEIAAKTYSDALVSVGLDTWGVDFGLLASDDTLLGNPIHYRDSRTDGMLEEAFKIVPRAEIYQKTGIQFMQLNTLYQLLALARQKSPALYNAKTFLNMPDLFNFWLTGRKASEFSIATTTQCYNPRTCSWDQDLLHKFNIPTQIFGEILPTGTVLGSLRASVISETGCRPISVIAPAGHDTGSAVAAVPASGSDYIYLSSGTWSLMGIEVKSPIINEQSLAMDFTNEGGVNGSIRFLKNIMGLWLVQECRRQWEKEGVTYTYDDLTRLAADAPAFKAFVVPVEARFLAPGDMAHRIQTFCKETGQFVPESHQAIIRCALESLALEYRWVAEKLDQFSGRRLSTIHIIGGGSRNHLLNQFTADATGKHVFAGPVEATAIGNLLVQAMAMGVISTLEEGRAMVRRSFEISEFTPGDQAEWDQAYERYLKLKG